MTDDTFKDMIREKGIDPESDQGKLALVVKQAIEQFEMARLEKRRTGKDAIKQALEELLGAAMSKLLDATDIIFKNRKPREAGVKLAEAGELLSAAIGLLCK